MILLSLLQNNNENTAVDTKVRFQNNCFQVSILSISFHVSAVSIITNEFLLFDLDDVLTDLVTMENTDSVAMENTDSVAVENSPSPSRQLRSATASPGGTSSLRAATSSPATRPSNNTPISELTQKTKESTVIRKRKTEASDNDDDTSSSSSSSQGNKSRKRVKSDEQINIDEQTDIEFNREEKKFVNMKVRSGDSISSPCWSSKLCQVATLTKEGISLMKKTKSKYRCFNNNTRLLLLLTI